MAYLILCALMNVGIFTAFRIFPARGVNTFQAIVINYLFCVITGLVFSQFAIFKFGTFEPWMAIGMALGAVFIGTFYLMARTTQLMGITVASVASKISLAIPVVFALFIFNLESKTFTVINYLGLILTVFAIYFSSVKEGGIDTSRSQLKWLAYPLAVFVLGEIIDTTFNYTNHRYLTDAEAPTFLILIFASAALIGFIIMAIHRKPVQKRNIAAGLILGVINYFSVYFVLLTLSAFDNDGAVVFPVLNMFIIVGSTITSVAVFSEKLNARNKLGLGLAFLVIVLVSYQELWLSLS